MPNRVVAVLEFHSVSIDFLMYGRTICVRAIKYWSFIIVLFSYSVSQFKPECQKMEFHSVSIDFYTQMTLKGFFDIL